MRRPLDRFADIADRRFRQIEITARDDQNSGRIDEALR
jgi:hypothetical protein